LALNYAAGGLNLAGYHLVNLGVHLLATLTLFGLIRRTLASGATKIEATRALPIALAAALLWSLHPLQTEAVTYISQRAESQMGLFYLLTVYCFARFAGSTASAGLRSGTLQAFRGPTALEPRMPVRLPLLEPPTHWAGLSIICCLCGMATKEVTASAPLLVLLYDRTFVAGSFASAWRQRRGYYIGLAATWILLAGEVIAGKSRGGTTGFNLGISWPGYVFTECSAITHYLRLAIWPSPLVFDYGLAPAFSPPVLAVLAAVFIGLLAALSFWALRRSPALGLLGIWFFAILAPTSLVPGNRQTWSEHRMYLALVPLAVLFGVLLMSRRRVWAWPVLIVLAAACGAGTFARNRDYSSNLKLWSDTAAKRPDNAFAHYNVGEELLREKQYAAAEVSFRRALALNGKYAEAHNNLGNVLVQTGHASAAQAEFEVAARLKPTDPEIRNNLGNAFLEAGRIDVAEAEYRAAIAADPKFANPHDGLAETYVRRKDLAGAVTEYQTALRLDPTVTAIHESLGGVLLRLGRSGEAIQEFAEAVSLSPADPAAHFNYGNALAQQKRFIEALGQFEAALRLNPADPLIHYNYGTALVLSGRIPEARQQYAEALRLKPTFEQARARLRMLEGH